jgi:hypothetical protein
MTTTLSTLRTIWSEYSDFVKFRGDDKIFMEWTELSAKKTHSVFRPKMFLTFFHRVFETKLYGFI